MSWTLTTACDEKAVLCRSSMRGAWAHQMHQNVLMPWPSPRTRITPLQPWPALLVACTLLGVTCLRELSTLHAATADISELWQEPVGLERSDLTVGSWGRANAPDPEAIY